jgi:uncharacterized repeat protein (TIGR02543 family)
MMFTLLPNITAHAASYNIDKAEEYAKAHWNDGVGLCADFCSACLRAGGIDVNISGTRTLKNFLVDRGYASVYLLTTAQGVNLRWSSYSDKVSPGDIIINYCPTCQVYPHVVFVSDDKSDGYIRYYAHNAAKNNQRYYTGSTGYGSHPGHSFQTYVIHINNGVYGGVEQPKPVHTHSFERQTESGHPHKIYDVCSCGEKIYRGTGLISSCKDCFPLGSVKLTRSFDKVGGTATFYRNDVRNAHSYTLKVYKDSNLYGTYNMSNISYKVSGLPAGSYHAVVTAKSNNTGETRSASCSTFRIVNTYTVSYNANGGSGAPSSQTKIQDSPMTITTSKPYREHYVFKGWASSKTATEAQYQPGGTYTKNTKITLYAVWEPETYTISFDINGGKGELSDTTITYGDTMKMPNTVVQDGYYLKGWAKSNSASEPDYLLGRDYKIEENLKLYAVWGASTWFGDVATSFAGGDGTEENPYQISNSAELAYLAKIVNSQSAAPEYKYYILTDNINMGYNEWVPIGLLGNANQYFYGSFDGNGYTISDLYMTQPNEGNLGLFGYTKDSKISNLNITGAIENVSSGGKLTVGGIAGHAEKTEILKCNAMYFTISGISSVDDEYSSIGCIVGMASSGGNISDCTVKNGSINLRDGDFEAGILAGNSSVNINNCTVISEESGLFSAASGTDDIRLGGLCGNLSGNAEKCSVNAPYFTNELYSSASNHTGGLVGYLSGAVSVCSVQFKNGNSKSINGGNYNSSIYSSAGNSIISGGLVGFAQTNNAKITDCKYDGQSITGISSSAYAITGGLAGRMDAKTNPKVSVNGGQSLSRADLPTKTGYKATWYTDANFQNEYDFSQVLTDDITLYAKWEKGDDTPDIWDGTSKEPAYNAETKTYTITNGEELSWVSDVSNEVITSGENFPDNISFKGYTIELANDIYLNDTTDWENWNETNAPANEWKPISPGYYNGFAGIFDGKNYVIEGIYIYSDDTDIGLFGSLINIIKNVSTSHGYINGYVRTGGIVGVNHGHIISCNNTVTISGDSDTGGIAGKVEKGGAINNCSNSGIISGSGNSGTGGIAGDNGGSISYCYNTAPINGSSHVGGIAGSSYEEITYCYNKASVNGTTYVGGITGSISSWNDNGYISFCYNSGNITGKGDFIGGIVGDTHQKISNSYNLGVVSTNGNYVGGITGYNNYTSVEYCYNTANVSGGELVASIVGSLRGFTFVEPAAAIHYCYALNSPLYVKNGDNFSIKSVSQKTSAQMKILSNLTGFSTSVWSTNANINNGYPYLKLLEETYKTYTVTYITEGDNNAISRSFANIDGIIYSDAKLNAYSGGILGEAYGSADNNSTAKGLISIADNISSKTSSSSSNESSGYVVGYNLNNSFDFTTSYYNSDVLSNGITNTTGTSRPLTALKIPSFLTTLVGLNAYESINHLNEDETAVWVIKSGELPELYYNVLNDVSISKDIVNGTVAVDKEQAVDGEIVTVTASPAEGYVLNTIYVNGIEIAGNTFEMSGDADIYATFTEETKDYNITVQSDENASATLVNDDEAMPVMLMAVNSDTAQGTSELTAKDGTEIQVNTFADEQYTVDSVMVNGEEVIGDSFIVTDNSVVTLQVESLDTGFEAVTNDAQDVREHSAVVSGSVTDSSEGVGRYIRYWSADDISTVYTTNVEEGSGEYNTEIFNLDSNTKYYYQMTEFGEIKSFTTLEEAYTGEDLPDGENNCITTTTYKKLNTTYKFTIKADREVNNENVYVALYDENGNLLNLAVAVFDGDIETTVTVPIISGIRYADVFVWKTEMSPAASAERIQIIE